MALSKSKILKSSILFLIPVVVMYSLLLSYLVNVTVNKTETENIIYDSQTPHHRLVLLDTIYMERSVRKAISVNDEYNFQDGISKETSPPVSTTRVSLHLINKRPKLASVFQGAEITMVCQATNDSETTYLWQHVDGGKLDPNRITGINSSELTITNALPDDAGTYICITSNKDIKTESTKAILYVKVQCPTDLSIENGYVKFSRYSKYVAYHCNSGFRLVGSASATCKDDGTWSSQPPKCTVSLPVLREMSVQGSKLQVECPTNVTINNGYVRFTSDGSMASFRCTNGFKLVGAFSITCNEDGTWNLPPPKCVVWKACQWSRIPIEFTKIAEHVATNPPELRAAAINCGDRYRWYLRRWSRSTLNRLCNNFGVSNLTSNILQYKFMFCTGLYLYKYLSDVDGNVQVPKQFHNCKKMSFRNYGISTLLVSWPGSGNSWVRQLLETTTGIYTGSYKDCDLAYINAGMLGEGIDSENVIAVKFHIGPYPEFHFKKVIYIIRNPYDAFVADYQRDVLSRDPRLFQKAHINEVGIDKFGDYEEWRMYVNRAAFSWGSHIHQWLGTRLPHGSTVLVVKFENLLTNLRTELIRILKYLEYPYTEEDLDCTIKSNNNMSVFHRNHTNSFEHYTQNEADIIYEQIKLTEIILRNYNITIYDKHVLQS